MRFEEIPYVMTVEDVAALLQIGRNSALQIFHSNDFPSFKIGKQLRVTQKELLNWLDRQIDTKSADGEPFLL